MNDHTPTETKEIPAERWVKWCDTFSSGNLGRPLSVSFIDDVYGDEPLTDEVAFVAIDYDPVNNVFIFYGRDFHTWAYRYKAGSTSVNRTVGAVADMALTVEPNPFTSAVVIWVLANRWGSPAVRPNGLAIYNIHGRLVQRMDNIQMKSYTWNASRLPAGLYLIRARVDGKILQKKVVLQK